MFRKLTLAAIPMAALTVALLSVSDAQAGGLPVQARNKQLSSSYTLTGGKNFQGQNFNRQFVNNRAIVSKQFVNKPYVNNKLFVYPTNYKTKPFIYNTPYPKFVGPWWNSGLYVNTFPTYPLYRSYGCYPYFGCYPYGPAYNGWCW